MLKTVATCVPFVAAGFVAGCAREPGDINPCIADATSATEKKIAGELFREAMDTIYSEEFKENLKKYMDESGEIYLNRNKPRVDFNYMIKLIDNRSLFFAPRIRILGNMHDDSDITKYEASTGYYGLFVLRPDTIIGRVHLARFNDSDIVARSCAINTMSHEISHSISTTANHFEMSIEDTTQYNQDIRSNSEPYNPIASYTIGSVAQCTYLQTHGRIGRDGIVDCIRVFGVKSFNGSRCYAFPDNKSVVMSADLPPPSRPI